ncbi:MAG: extracellular solute-binding protein [Limnochordia bacterium]|jgi:multiple sugar transport system substrate-binding protein
MRYACRGSVVVAVLCVLLSLASAVSAGKVKVVYQYNWYGSTGRIEDAYLELVEQFKRDNPNVEVELVRGSSSPDKLITAIAGGTPQDVVQFERSIIIEWANKGLLLPIDKLMETSVKGAWLPGTYSEVCHEGQSYGVPWDTDIRGLFWNKDLIAEGGMDDSRGPATLSELDDMARKLTKRDAEGKFTQLGFIPWLGNWYAVGWLYTFGGALYDPTTKQPVVNTPNHVRGFEWLQTYGERYSVSAVGAVPHGVDKGRTAMEAHYIGHGRTIEVSIPGLDYGVGEVPHPDYGQNGTWMGGTAHVVPLGARNMEGAKVLMNWLARKEVQATWWRLSAALPTRTDAIPLIRHELPASQAILLLQANVAFGRPPLWFPAIYNRTREAMMSVVQLRQAPKTALDEAQRLLEMDFAAVFGK